MRQLEAELEEYFQTHGLEIETLKIVDTSHIFLEHNLNRPSYMLQFTMLQHYVIYPVATSWENIKTILEGEWYLHDKRCSGMLQPTLDKTLSLSKIVNILKQIKQC